jgi:multidrug resistance efflux pump
VAALMLVGVLGFWWLQWQGAPSTPAATAAARIHPQDHDD